MAGVRRVRRRRTRRVEPIWITVGRELVAALNEHGRADG
jgi:hypothetical protein